MSYKGEVQRKWFDTKTEMIMYPGNHGQQSQRETASFIKSKVFQRLLARMYECAPVDAILGNAGSVIVRQMMVH